LPILLARTRRGVVAVLTIAVHRDAGSSRTTVRVDLCSDEDVMPHEHESAHRQLVAALLPGAAAERERPAREPVVG
jgi:hypothetical protein